MCIRDSIEGAEYIQTTTSIESYVNLCLTMFIIFGLSLIHICVACVQQTVEQRTVQRGGIAPRVQHHTVDARGVQRQLCLLYTSRCV